MMLIQEGILISIFFAALLTMIIADRVFRCQKPKPVAPEVTIDKKSGEARTVQVTIKNTAYDFSPRIRTVKSLPGKALLFLGLVNYAYSFAFWSNYRSYLNSQIVQDNTTC